MIGEKSLGNKQILNWEKGIVHFYITNIFVLEWRPQRGTARKNFGIGSDGEVVGQIGSY